MDWQGDIPVGAEGDRYYAGDGLAEGRHVYLAGCGLPGRFAPGFRIAELGFGTGLNLAIALHAWREAGAPGPLRYTGFEARPLARADMARALAAFPELAREAEEIVREWPEAGTPRRIALPGLDAEIRIGDARETVPAWESRADAWFLDGFAPALNPEMWEEDLLRAVAERLAPGGTASSFTAAGHVRRALAAAGLTVERRAGFGRKRHMTVATAPGPR